MGAPRRLKRADKEILSDKGKPPLVALPETCELALKTARGSFRKYMIAYVRDHQKVPE